MVVIVVAVWLVTNVIYQVVRKPSELFFPVSGTLFKTPTDTPAQRYAPIFAASTRPRPSLRAARRAGAGRGIGESNCADLLALVLEFGKPFEIYRPATSAVGMYQMTDGTFAEARHYCVHDHAVVTDGAWNELHTCWFNDFYVRVIPSHAVELTSAYLDVHVASTLARNRITKATLLQKQHLAATIHLCGAGAGDLYARHGFHFAEGQRCGDHDPRVYIGRVDTMMTVFAHLAAEDED